MFGYQTKEIVKQIIFPRQTSSTHDSFDPVGIHKLAGSSKLIQSLNCNETIHLSCMKVIAKQFCKHEKKSWLQATLRKGAMGKIEEKQKKMYIITSRKVETDGKHAKKT